MLDRVFTGFLILALAGQLGAASEALAQSAKATARVANIAFLHDSDSDWEPILAAAVRAPNDKDLFIDVSLECSVLTETRVLSSGGIPDMSTAEGAVDVRVVIDPGTPAERLAHPQGEAMDGVTFCQRRQQLEGVYAGIENCETDPETGEEECETSEEETRLLLETLNANSFNFIAEDLASGDHVVRVEARARVVETPSENGGDARAVAAIGNGSVTIEVVRMIRGTDVAGE